MKNLWARKSIEQTIRESSGEHSQLSRTLTRTNLILLGVGAIVGAGIFVLTGQAAAQHAGPAISISFVLAGIACAFAGLCYAEFAAMIPISGSAYAYAYSTLGEFIAWIIGWDLILEYLFGASTVAVGWSGYVVHFFEGFGIEFSERLVNAPFTFDPNTSTFEATGAIFNFPAMLIIGIMTTMLVLGIKESARINNIIVIVKVIVILLFVGYGMAFIDTSNWDPFIPENTGVFGEFGVSGLLRAAGVIFFAYIGFDAVSTLAQEAKNPQKDMPWGILGSLVICTVLYILVGLVMTGVVDFHELNNAAPVATALSATGDGGAWLKTVVNVGAIAGLSSVVLVMLMSQPRIFFSMANDGLLPQFFAKIHHKYKTPYITTIMTGCFSGIIAGLFPIGLLGELVSIGTLLAFAIVCGGILVLRYKQPDIPRPFKTPLFPVVPILGVLASLGVMATLPGDTWWRLIVWMLVGILIYLIYGQKNSKLQKARGKA